MGIEFYGVRVLDKNSAEALRLMRKSLPILIVVALLGASYPLHFGYKDILPSLRADFAKKADPDILLLPRSETMKSLRFGYEGILSDILWLRGIAYIQAQLDLPQGPARYRQLRALYEAVTNLDPYFIDGYRYGSIFLSVLVRDQDAAIAILKKGLGYPENRRRWELYYDLGALYFLEKEDFDKAAENFRLASLDPNAPDYVPHVASYFLRVTKKEHGTALALSLWRQRLQSKNEEVRKIARQEIAKITVAQTHDTHMELLQRAAEKFKEIEGRWPKGLQELLTPGILGKLPEKQAADLFAKTVGRPPKDRQEMLTLSVLKKLPEEPTGGSYRIDPETGQISFKEDPKGWDRIFKAATVEDKKK